MLTGDQVTELDRIKKSDGGPAHNARLLEIIRGEQIHGFVKLYKAVRTVTKNSDRLAQMKSLIPDEYLSSEHAALSASTKEATYGGKQYLSLTRQEGGGGRLECGDRTFFCNTMIKNKNSPALAIFF